MTVLIFDKGILTSKVDFKSSASRIPAVGEYVQWKDPKDEDLNDGIFCVGIVKGILHSQYGVGVFVNILDKAKGGGSQEFFEKYLK